MKGEHPHKDKLLNDWAPAVAGEGLFSAEDCERTLALASEMKDAGIERGENKTAYREGRVCWLRPAPENHWLFAKVWELCGRINQERYKLELSGFTEPLQLGQYGPGHFYDWHLDFGPKGFSARKLSFVVQLTDPADYEGGALEILASNEVFQAPRARGSLIVFPSFILHRVQAVTEGTRHSLVGWIGGPPLR